MALLCQHPDTFHGKDPQKVIYGNCPGSPGRPTVRVLGQKKTSSSPPSRPIGSKPPNPHRLLALAVIAQAVEDVQHGERAVRRDALSWVLGDLPGFGEICDLVDLCPSSIRRHAKVSEQLGEVA